MHLIVGLGNPGPKYTYTRHNIGFLCIDEFINRYALGPAKIEKKAEVWKGRIGTKTVLFAKPQTFMNLSGQSVGPLMQFYKIEAENLIVLHDDVDLPYKRMKMQVNRGHGGQNGVRDIHKVLGHNQYARLKLGIGRPTNPRMDIADFVLSRFSEDEMLDLEAYLERAMDAVELFVTDGLEKAADTYNRKE